MSADVFTAVAGAVAVVAGAVASIAGFGIGSLLTPVFAAEMGMRTAVAAVAIPHAAGTALRLWTMRRAVDRRVLRGFGLASAGGGLAGALLHGVASNPAIGLVFAALLVMAGGLGVIGLAEKVRLDGIAAWIAGGVAGVFGGLAGNQGGIRSAALLGMGLQRDAFVATATAVALIIDAVRLPVYVATSHEEMLALAPVIAVATAGALLGTIAGTRALGWIPERSFRRIVSAFVLVLGLALLVRGI